ncbi:choline transporter [Tessaracoccus flavus]|uniref:Choline transporter n=1 Tax=Tessaracoccus flavus TaxID=1610493 RepID=A0A1Q2CIV8_9ACTN|nr:choline transporter [Tessaracoccus flavus]
MLQEVNYPHNIHPALVPGVSIEDQRVKYRVDTPIVAVVGVLILSFIVWGIVRPDNVLEVSSAALTWVMSNLGWVFTAMAAGLVVFLLIIAFSRYGRIPLGLDDETPQYSTPSWAAMLFAAGIGIGIIFFGAYEPLTYYLAPRPGAYEPGSMDAITGAMAQGAMHWGINAWAFYAVVGLAVAYVSYRRGRVPLMSSILASITGGDSSSPAARTIDGLAIIATLFGTASSLGIGALQIGRGVEIVSGWSFAGNTMAILIIVVLTIGTIISAVSGVAKGIRKLSNINMFLSMGLALFFFVVGPTAFLLNVIPAVMIDYLGSMPEMLSANMSQGPEMQAFLSSWTIFYWAWWVSWAPFVGVFVAKISRGRTIRQFILGVLFIPSTIIIVAFTVLGGTAIWLQRETGALAPDGTAASLPAPAEIFYAVLEMLPGASIVAPLVILMLAIFFITSADSASLVNSQLSQGGNPEPNRLVTAFWAICMAGIAVVMLLTGGNSSLQGLQNLVTVTALPFSVIIVLMCLSLYRELRHDPLAIRDQYGRWALEKAVRRGVRQEGDNFALAIVPTQPDSEYATGAAFDSTAEEVTGWYARTDEEGEPVEYDYTTGEYLEPGAEVEPPPIDRLEEALLGPDTDEPLDKPHRE